MKNKIYWMIVLIGFIVGCATVPETGRYQLNLLSSDEECRLGLSGFEEIKKQTPICKDPAINALVQKVGKRIAAVANLPNAQWEFVVFESQEANAFCLPGGKVGVYTGILQITKNEAGLATVIGHEVAHAVARHGAERVSQALVIQAGGSVLGKSISNADPRVQSAVMLAYGVGATVGVELPYSRMQESESDHIGLLYMARAGYDPREAIAFWQRFSDYNKARGASNTPSFLRTHPLDEKRIEQLKAWLPEALAQYKPQQ
ncbi:MAG: M48 family metallopeptidase [Verrucomicrobiae bacterium]|nr:M48 family metallopeptidase [Verrucomicrobiae bacterium]